MGRPLGNLQRRFEESFRADPETDCWAWMGVLNPAGYGIIGVKTDKFRARLAHRVSWMLYRGELPESAKVLHRCDTPCCVNPKHLFLGTMKDNTQDSIVKGRWDGVGFKRVVTNDVVREIRSSGLSGRQVMAKYGISKSSAYGILKRTRWSHVQ